VPVSNGHVDFYNGSGGTVQLVADVAGYFSAGAPAAAGAFGALTPVRLMDTRRGLGSPGPVGPASAADLRVAGVGGVPANASAVLMTVTETDAAASGFLTVFAHGQARPGTSDLNHATGQTVSNLVFVPVIDGQVALYNGSQGAIQIVADVDGYFVSGPPPQPPAPVAVATTSPDQTSTSVGVTWAAQSSCGDSRPCVSYLVTEFRGGAAVSTLQVASCPGGACLATFGPLANDGSVYTYSVVDVNLEGQSSPASPASNAVNADGVPSSVGDLAVSSGNAAGVGFNGSLSLTFTVPASHGSGITLVRNSVTGQTWSNPGATGAQVTESLSGLANGQTYNVSVTVCNAFGSCSAASNTGSGVPYGPPGAPAAGAAASGNSITFSWSGGGGNGRNVASYYVCIDGGSCASHGAGNTGPVAFACQQTHSVEVYAVDTAGQHSPTTTASTPTGSCPPPPTPQIHASNGGSNGAGAYYLNISVSNFPTGTYWYYCHDNGGPGGSDVIFESKQVSVNNPNQSTWPGAFCWETSGLTAYLVMDGYTSNPVAF